MKLLPEKSSAKIPLTQTEQDKAIIKQSKPSNITKNGNLDNSIPSSNNNRTKSIKKPASKPIVKPNTIKNESKVSEPVVVPKKTVNTPIVEKTATEVIKPKNSIYTSQEKAESYVKWHEKELQNP